MSMKLNRVSSTFCLIAAAVAVAWPFAAHAYGRSEDEEMREEVHEALQRAHDFRSQRVREATEDLERERGAKEVKRERAAFEAGQEKVREDFVTERNSKPPDVRLEAKMEREFDQEKAVEDREMDRARIEYRLKRKEFSDLIRKKAHINENEEYGL